MPEKRNVIQDFNEDLRKSLDKAVHVLMAVVFSLTVLLFNSGMIR